MEIGIGLFAYFLHDDYAGRFRKMLIVEQFHEKKLASIYSSQYVDGPISYQKQLFRYMIANGTFIDEDVDMMALRFYSPIYMLLTLCDREPDREPEAIRTLEKHFGRKRLAR